MKIKSFQIISLLSTVLLISIIILPDVTTAAGIQFYKIDVDIDENNKAIVNLVITFKEPEKHLSFDVIGRVENFEATSNAGPIECNVEVSGISYIDCNMSLTEYRKEVEIKFETMDFVRMLDNKLYFSADLSPSTEIDGVSATCKLPLGFLLVGENITSSILSYPLNASAHIVGGRILVVWKLSNIEADEKLKFEILYEQVKTPPWFQLRIRHFVLFGTVFAVVLGFVLIRYARKSEKLVLSVLDEHERMIMEIITREGEIKQRKIVQLTNLSKAKVSRVVKSLAERGLIEVERIGRTNRIRLSKKKFEI